MKTFDFLSDDRLRQQVEFLALIDRMKQVLRQNLVADASRRENDAEHSWHMAVTAMVLSEYATEPVDIPKAAELALVHDLVEIYAGDTFAYDTVGYQDKAARETAAAERLFGSLPGTQGAELRAFWEEFEACDTPESRFANIMDRFQPLILNYLSGGHTWKTFDVHKPTILKRNEIIRTWSPQLWIAVNEILDQAVKEGLLKE
ncbi:MAG: HD domain-containing protein [Clostridia bacterium]|nr:HD domain-containing protein [Clostridia bacterium]